MKRALLSLVGLLLGLAVYYLAPEMFGERQPVAVPTSDLATGPAINVEHIFEGQINRRGKPVGFHSRPGGHDPEGARLVRRVSGPNGAGVYIAEVEIRNGSDRWLRKTSTFYPDRLDRDEVVAAILHAWEDRRDLGGGKFQGDSGEGFTIEGYTLDDGGINTAYPLYKR